MGFPSGTNRAQRIYDFGFYINHISSSDFSKLIAAIW